MTTQTPSLRCRPVCPSQGRLFFSIGDGSTGRPIPGQSPVVCNDNRLYHTPSCGPKWREGFCLEGRCAFLFIQCFKVSLVAWPASLVPFPWHRLGLPTASNGKEATLILTLCCPIIIVCHVPFPLASSLPSLALRIEIREFASLFLTLCPMVAVSNSTDLLQSQIPPKAVLFTQLHTPPKALASWR